MYLSWKVLQLSWKFCRSHVCRYDLLNSTCICLREVHEISPEYNVQGAAVIDLLEKAVGARHPDLLHHRQCLPCPGDSPTAGKWGGQGSSLVASPLNKWWIRCRVLGQQKMVPETKLETRMSRPTQEPGSKSKLETRYPSTLSGKEAPVAWAWGPPRQQRQR